MLTIEDIRNHGATKSGFTGVSYDGGKKPWRAQVYGSGRSHHGPGGGLRSWRGRRRATAEEAAQDYCNHINGQPHAPAPTESWATPTIDMGGVTTHAPKARLPKTDRVPYTGKYDLYDVLCYTANGDLMCRKVGITARGESRYEGLRKTFGISIKPNAQAITFPDKRLAKKAEDALIASVEKDPEWRKIGKESFAPVKKEVPSA